MQFLRRVCTHIDIIVGLKKRLMVMVHMIQVNLVLLRNQKLQP